MKMYSQEKASEAKPRTDEPKGSSGAGDQGPIEGEVIDDKK